MRILKEATIEAIRLKISGATEPIIKGVEAKPKILVEEDIWANSITEQIV